MQVVASPQLIASSGPLDLCPPPQCTGTVVQPYTAMPCLWCFAFDFRWFSDTFIVSDMTTSDIPRHINPELSPQGRSFRPSATSPGGGHILRPLAPEEKISGGGNILWHRSYTIYDRTVLVQCQAAGRRWVCRLSILISIVEHFSV